jgi:rubredoxin
MATTTKPKKKDSVKKPVTVKKKAIPAAKKKAVAQKMPGTKKKIMAAKKPATVKKTVAKKPVKKPLKKAVKKLVRASAKKGKSYEVQRYRCRLCGYVYSPLIGEPHNGIPAGTAFEDLPDDYVCPVCGQEGRGRIGKWGFDEWRPTKYICSICGYVYDEQRGEPYRGIKPGTKFDNLPDDYVCPICATDPRIHLRIGDIFKQGFGPLKG